MGQQSNELYVENIMLLGLVKALVDELERELIHRYQPAHGAKWAHAFESKMKLVRDCRERLRRHNMT